VCSGWNSGSEEGVESGSGNMPIDMDACTVVSICGNSFCLEDSKSMMTDEEAHVWFKATLFSPLVTHHQICPF
jgi:hypothetical protein